VTDNRFWVSTGDIRETYEVMNIVATRIFGLMEPNFQQASRQAVDNLAQAALQIGANGVIWIRITPLDKEGLGFGVYATGTAVRVLSVAPETPAG
jgi:uncharacterized protein YbjQ (UPF0145 family)